MALNPTRAAGMIAPLWEHYAPGTDARLASEVAGRLCHALEAHAPDATVLALRDYHAENLVWRPRREGSSAMIRSTPSWSSRGSSSSSTT